MTGIRESQIDRLIREIEVELRWRRVRFDAKLDTGDRRGLAQMDSAISRLENRRETLEIERSQLREVIVATPGVCNNTLAREPEKLVYPNEDLDLEREAAFERNFPGESLDAEAARSREENDERDDS